MRQALLPQGGGKTIPIREPQKEGPTQFQGVAVSRLCAKFLWWGWLWLFRAWLSLQADFLYPYSRRYPRTRYQQLHPSLFFGRAEQGIEANRGFLLAPIPEHQKGGRSNLHHKRAGFLQLHRLRRPNRLAPSNQGSGLKQPQPRQPVQGITVHFRPVPRLRFEEKKMLRYPEEGPDSMRMEQRRRGSRDVRHQPHYQGHRRNFDSQRWCGRNMDPGRTRAAGIFWHLRRGWCQEEFATG